MKATPLVRLSDIDSDGDRIEVVIWRIPATGAGAESIRYRLAFLPNGLARPSILYDNHPPKGHHKHCAGVEVLYEFSNVDALIVDFVEDISRWKESRR